MSPDLTKWAAEVIAVEADNLMKLIHGATERSDLKNEGWLVVLKAPENIAPGALRLRIRGAMKDLLRHELRAHGRVKRNILWPVFWPKRWWRRGWKPFKLRRCVDCKTTEVAPNAKRCVVCAEARRLMLQRFYNKHYQHLKPLTPEELDVLKRAGYKGEVSNAEESQKSQGWSEADSQTHD